MRLGMRADVANTIITRSNKIITKSNKIVTACASEPSCTSGCGAVPNTWQVVISGVTMCTSCTADNYSTLWCKVSSGTINGTFCASYIGTGSACEWKATMGTPVVIDFFPTSACSGVPIATVTITDIVITISGGTASVSIAGASTPILPTVYPFYVILFTGTLSGCAGGTVSNTISSCQGFLSAWYTYYMATGGSASLVTNGC
jgi:hypothetical protein